MLVVVVEFQIKPAFIDAFACAIVDNARASRETEPGCRQFDVCRDLANPSVFFLYELYDDASAFEAHLRSPHFLLMDGASRSWVERKTARRFERIDP
jgi:quinol monooxygenase YgiN